MHEHPSESDAQQASLAEREERDYRESISVARGPLYAIGLSVLFMLVAGGIIVAILAVVGR